MKRMEVKNQKNNKLDIEDIIIQNILSSKEINLESISNKDLKILIKNKIVEASYLNEEWQIHYAIEKVMKKIRPNWEKRNLAIVTLLFGILGFVYISNTSIVSSIVAIICGHKALSKIKKDPDTYTGKTFAKVGLILGYLGLAIKLFIGIIFVGIKMGF